MRIYLQGLTMGLAYVAPIGLQNLFVINSALTQRRSRVYLTALIVILWDVSLGVSCFLGAGALMQALPWLQKVILGIGSLIVIWIGIGLLRSRASLEGGAGRQRPHLEADLLRLCGHLDQSPGPDRRHHDAGGLPGQPAGGRRPAVYLRLRQRLRPVVPDPVHGGVSAGQPVQRKDPQRHQQGLRRGHHLLWLQAAVELCEAHGLALIRREEAMYRGMAASWAATDTAIMAGMLTSYSTPSSQLPKNQNTPKAHSNTP